MSEAKSEKYRIELFGSLQVSWGVSTIVQLEQTKNNEIFAYLASHSIQIMREHLGGIIWPQKDKPLASLSTALFRLKRYLKDKGMNPDDADDLFKVDRSYIGLNSDRVIVDVIEFDKLLKEAKNLKDATSVDSIQKRAGLRKRAVALYKTDFLIGWYQDWVSERQRTYRTAFEAELLPFAQDLEFLEDWKAAQTVAERARDANPTGEEIIGFLMKLHARCGRPSQATRIYDDYKELLQKDAATPPSCLHNLCLCLRQNPDAFLRQTDKSRTPSISTPAIPAPLNTKQKDRFPKPPPDRFFGQEMLMFDVKKLIDDHANGHNDRKAGLLITLKGPGGIGKSRVAIELANAIRSSVEHACYLNLEALQNPDLLAETITQALELSMSTDGSHEETLMEYFKEQEILLVLDNCDQLAKGCDLLEKLISTSRGLHILTTSREQLGIKGEKLLNVDALSLPTSAETPSIATLDASEAAQLFIDRASHQVAPIKDVTAITKICEAVAGIPLALELAARWVGTLSVEQIAEDLQNLINLPGKNVLPKRQRTMTATVDWSYDRLSQPHQQLLRALSVFVGGFTREAVYSLTEEENADSGEAVYCDTTPNERALSSLKAMIDRSLITFDQHTVRYRILEPVREVLRKRLVGAEEREAIARHLKWCTKFAEIQAAELYGPNQANALHLMAQEQSNFRIALETAFRESGANDGIDLIMNLARFWAMRGYFTDGKKYLQQALVSISGTDTDTTSLRGRLLSVYGLLTYYSGDDYPTAQRLCTESLGILDEIGQEERAMAFNCLGMVADIMDNHETAMSNFESSLIIYKRMDLKWGEAEVLRNMADAKFRQNYIEDAEHYYPLSLTINTESGNKTGKAAVLYGIGNVALAKGEYTKASATYERCRTLWEELDDKRNIAKTWSSLGNVDFANKLYNEAYKKQIESLRINWEMKNMRGIAYALEGLASALIGEGKQAEAEPLWGIAQYLRQIHKCPRTTQEERQISTSQFPVCLINWEARSWKMEIANLLLD